MAPKCDFSGWATRNDLRCSDGRIIRKNAFKVQDGTTVPLVWAHLHDDPENFLGHALLENRDEGVYAYCTFNSNPKSQQAKELVQHGDITCLSIHAGNLKQSGSDVLHGKIREVSLVMSGANPGAKIRDIYIAHSDEALPDEFIVEIGNDIADIQLSHEEKIEEEPMAKNPQPIEEQEIEHADNPQDEIDRIIKSMNEEQRNLMYALIGTALSEGDDATHSDEGGNEMVKNVFEQNGPARRNAITLTHDDMESIKDIAQKGNGSLKDATKTYLEDYLAELNHADGDDEETAEKYGIENIEILFPDARAMQKEPQIINHNTLWVGKFLQGASKSPFSRIKSTLADITADAARAKGYVKGNRKKEEYFPVMKRITTPQTIYKKQKLDRDDIIDITDFDVVAFLRAEMRVKLNEEVARAGLFGDGRDPEDEDKIHENYVRPIATDDPIYVVYARVEGASNELMAKNFIRQAIRSRRDYEGTGSPILFVTTDILTDMLLLEDGIGRRLYETEASLAAALRVREIVEVPIMKNMDFAPHERADVTAQEGDKLLGIFVNPADYTYGADKGGEVNMFDDFDIDFNQYKYLIETRTSGCLTKYHTAMVFGGQVTSGASAGNNSSDEPAEPSEP